MKYKLYHGTSPYLSLKAVHSYLDDIKEEDSSIGISILEADSLSPKIIFDTISSPTLFAKKRIIFIKRIYRNKEKSLLTDEITKILKEKNVDDVVIFWEDQKIKSNTKYYKFFKESNNIEEIDQLNKRTFFTWLRKELELHGARIDQSIIKELAERTNYDPERCSNEIKKFKLNNEEKIIEKDDLETLTADTLEKDIWDLIDAINQGDKVKSMMILDRLSSQFVDVNYTLSMLARNLRLISLTKYLLDQKMDYREISSLLKVPPFTMPSLAKSASKYTNEKITTLYSKLSNLDFQIKIGKIDGNLGLTLICPYL